MSRKLTYNEVKYFIESESKSDCELLSTEYINNIQKLKIKCPCENIFYANFNAFKQANKRQCNDCGYKNISKKSTLSKENISSYIKTNIDTDCKLINIENIKGKIYLDLICECGDSFKSRWDLFRHNEKSRYCRECQIKMNYKYSYDDIKYYIEIESNSGCKLLSEKREISVSDKLIMQCKCGDEFETDFSHFKHHIKQQCNRCSTIIRNDKNRFTTSEFKKKIFEVSGDEYTLLGEYKNAKTKVKLKHNICGEIWDVLPSIFLSGTRCPRCLISKGENFIREWLDEYSVKYLPQHTFDDCRDIYPLPFDFYLPEFNALVEFDGIQHYKPIDFGGKGDEIALRQHYGVVRRDSIKNEYCKNNNISLIRIPYWEMDFVDEILKDTFFTTK